MLRSALRATRPSTPFQAAQDLHMRHPLCQVRLPVVARRTGQVIADNTRLEAGQEIGARCRCGGWRATTSTLRPGIWLMQNTELGRGWLDTGRDGMQNAFSLN